MARLVVFLGLLLAVALAFGLYRVRYASAALVTDEERSLRFLYPNSPPPLGGSYRFYVTSPQEKYEYLWRMRHAERTGLSEGWKTFQDFSTSGEAAVVISRPGNYSFEVHVRRPGSRDAFLQKWLTSFTIED